MADKTFKTRLRPSRLTVHCTNCGRSIPYDPTTSINICSRCGSISRLMESYLSHSTFHKMESDMAQASSTTSSPPTGSDLSSMMARGDGDTSMGSFLTGATSLPEHNTGIDFDVDDDEDHFVDAEEEIDAESPAQHTVMEGLSADDSTHQDESEAGFSSTHHIRQESETAEDIEMEDAEIKDEQGFTGYHEPDNDEEHESEEELENEPAEEPEDLEEDQNEANTADEPPSGSQELFQSCFEDKPDHSHEDDDDFEILSAAPVTALPRFTTKKLAPDLAEHAPACNGSPGPSTPRSSSSRSPQPTEPMKIDPDKHLSPAIRSLQKFHNRAVDLIPRLPLSDHRYWIGVLHPDVSYYTCSQEKNFTWMRANRLTTVRTVWNAYQSATASDDFVLLLGLERLEMEDRMEELDYFNEKRIMLRAVVEGDELAKGRSLFAGLIRKKVEKGELKPVEVIEIED